MNIQHLKYVLEVARTGSISAAAKSLYMGQPNLSKGIKMLESELGIVLFQRTAKGVCLTKDGASFLGYAQSIVAQMEQLESMYKPQKGDRMNFGISVPRATYIASTFSKWLGKSKWEMPLDMLYKETNPNGVINDVADGASSIGIVRCQRAHEDFFIQLIEQKGLVHELLWEYIMVILMSKNHPLAGCDRIPYHMLDGYLEIVHGDLYFPVLPANESSAGSLKCGRNRIQIFDRASQFDILHSVCGSYLWTSPISYADLERYGMVMKPCTHLGTSRDLLVCRGKSFLGEAEHALIDAIKSEVKNLPIFSDIESN